MSGLSGPAWKPRAMSAASMTARREASARSLSRGSAEKAPLANMSKEAAASPSERVSDRAVGEAIAPISACAGVEEHADDREVEGRARLGGSVRPLRGRRERCPAVGARIHEMPPARVEGNVERRIVLAHDRDHVIRRRGQPAAIDPPMVEAPCLAEPQHLMRALAHRLRGQEAERLGAVAFGRSGGRFHRFALGTFDSRKALPPCHGRAVPAIPAHEARPLRSRWQAQGLP